MNKSIDRNTYLHVSLEPKIYTIFTSNTVQGPFNVWAKYRPRVDEKMDLKQTRKKIKMDLKCSQKYS